MAPVTSFLHTSLGRFAICPACRHGLHAGQPGDLAKAYKRKANLCRLIPGAGFRSATLAQVWVSFFFFVLLQSQLSWVTGVIHRALLASFYCSLEPTHFTAAAVSFPDTSAPEASVLLHQPHYLNRASPRRRILGTRHYPDTHNATLLDPSRSPGRVRSVRHAGNAAVPQRATATAEPRARLPTPRD